MRVQGRDHDMLIMTDMFTLAQNRAGAVSAYAISKINALNSTPLSVEEAVSMLVECGEAALGYCGDKEVTLMLAKQYAERGCPTMIRLRGAHGNSESEWHLVHDPLAGMIGTLCHEEKSGPPTLAGDISTYFTGEAVTITTISPCWKGNWDRTFKALTPLK